MYVSLSISLFPFHHPSLPLLFLFFSLSVSHSFPLPHSLSISIYLSLAFFSFVILLYFAFFLSFALSHLFSLPFIFFFSYCFCINQKGVNSVWCSQFNLLHQEKKAGNVGWRRKMIIFYYYSFTKKKSCKNIYNKFRLLFISINVFPNNKFFVCWYLNCHLQRKSVYTQ